MILVYNLSSILRTSWYLKRNKGEFPRRPSLSAASVPISDDKLGLIKERPDAGALTQPGSFLSWKVVRNTRCPEGLPLSAFPGSAFCLFEGNVPDISASVHMQPVPSRQAPRRNITPRAYLLSRGYHATQINTLTARRTMPRRSRPAHQHPHQRSWCECGGGSHKYLRLQDSRSDPTAGPNHDQQSSGGRIPLSFHFGSLPFKEVLPGSGVLPVCGCCVVKNDLASRSKGGR